MKRVMTVCIGTLLGLTLTVVGAAAADKAKLPTFNTDVAPILFRSCVGCHRPNSEGGWSHPSGRSRI
jgi:hypothetical protein